MGSIKNLLDDAKASLLIPYMLLTHLISMGMQGFSQDLEFGAKIWQL